MREILFKAKRIDNGEWVEGFLFHCLNSGEEWCIGNEPLSANDYSEIIGEYRTWFSIDESTVCQYTGLTDKNGNKIWENDLIECKEISYGQLIKHFLSQVEWDGVSTGFTFKNNQSSWVFMDSITVYECEVKGNIFDNPELIGGVANE